MPSKSTELIFILDRSGSMEGLEADTIGGFNAMISKQKQLPGTCHVTTVLFDHRYELLHQRQDLKTLLPLTAKDYFVRGTTALLDAMGRTIHSAGRLQKHLPEMQRAGQVMVVIITDGLENASTRYSRDRVQTMVRHQQERFGWTFLFLGANMDAIAAAAQVGIDYSRAVRYQPDEAGTRLSYQAVGDAIGHVRLQKPLRADWKHSIERDFAARGKQ